MNEHSDTGRRAASLAVLGGLVLTIGILVYLADRPASQAMPLPAWPRPGGGPWFGALGQWLPSFIHPFAFSLLTAAALAPSARPRNGACAAWCAVNAAFELGQHPAVAAWLDAALRQSVLPPALGRPLAAYFLRGRFDLGDLVAVLLGGLAAAAVLSILHEPDADHAH